MTSTGFWIPHQRTISSILIWLGVLSWAPFFVLLALDQPVSIFPFLATHLTGVLGGGFLRARAIRVEGGITTSQRGRKRKIASSILIYLGVLAWAPYFYWKYALQQPVELLPFLIVHLSGVLPGFALRLSIEAERFLPRTLRPGS